MRITHKYGPSPYMYTTLESSNYWLLGSYFSSSTYGLIGRRLTHPYPTIQLTFEEFVERYKIYVYSKVTSSRLRGFIPKIAWKAVFKRKITNISSYSTLVRKRNLHRNKQETASFSQTTENDWHKLEKSHLHIRQAEFPSKTNIHLFTNILTFHLLHRNTEQARKSLFKASPKP